MNTQIARRFYSFYHPINMRKKKKEVERPHVDLKNLSQNAKISFVMDSNTFPCSFSLIQYDFTYYFLYIV